jgi:hypothetical protein
VIGPRLATAIAFVVGGLAVVFATAAGGDGAVFTAVVRPPTLLRAALIGVSAMVAVILLSRSLSRLAGGSTDVPSLIRGVRLAFLALAAAAAGAGWALGDPLPLVVALVIAGVDVIETSLLLLVVLRHRS